MDSLFEFGTKVFISTPVCFLHIFFQFVYMVAKRPRVSQLRETSTCVVLSSCYPTLTANHKAWVVLVNVSRDANNQHSHHYRTSRLHKGKHQRNPHFAFESDQKISINNKQKMWKLIADKFS